MITSVKFCLSYHISNVILLPSKLVYSHESLCCCNGCRHDVNCSRRKCYVTCGHNVICCTPDKDYYYIPITDTTLELSVFWPSDTENRINELRFSESISLSFKTRLASVTSYILRRRYVK